MSFWSVGKRCLTVLTRIAFCNMLKTNFFVMVCYFFLHDIEKIIIFATTFLNNSHTLKFIFMKKSLLAIIAAIAICSVSVAQLSTPTTENSMTDFGNKSTYTRQWLHIGTPFVATDVFGNTVKLQDYLDSGKFVVIDYSCAWCGPCWNLHTSGMLEQINALADFQVLWIEVEQTNTTAQIFGPRGGSGYASQTQGNWTLNPTTGDTVSYPVIDDDANRTCLRTCAQLYAGSVPTLMLITPDGLYCNLSGYFSYQQVSQSVNNVRAIANSAPRQGSAPQCKINAGTTAITGVSSLFKALVNTVDPVTSITWTFSGGTPATASGDSVTTVFSSDGFHRVILEVSNANGTDRDTINVNTRSLPANVLSYTYGQSGSNNVGSSSSAKRTWAVSFPPEMLSNFSQVHHVETYISSQFPTTYTMQVFSGTATAPQTQLGSDVSLNVTASMADRNVSFTPSSPIAVDQSKTLWIVMSATATYPMAACAYTGNPNSNWVLNSSTWSHIQDLNPSLDYSWVISAFSTQNGIGSVLSNEEVALFPNPASDNVSIIADGLRYVDVIDLSGNIVMKVDGVPNINIEKLSSGVYMFRIVTDNGVAMRKVVKK